MRSNGPNVWQTCAVCGASIQTTTTIMRAQLPGSIDPSHIIAVPLVIHLGDGSSGHIAAHPAMLTEQMGWDD